MEKNLKNCGNSYSDLFEDFFRTDATLNGTATTTVNDADSLNTLKPADDIDILFSIPFQLQGNELINDQTDPSSFYYSQVQAPPPQMMALQQQLPSYFYQQAQMSAFPYQPSAVGASVHKPGFVRNRTRKNMRQKSVASAVRASHLLNTEINPVMPLDSNFNINDNIQQYQYMLYQQQQQAAAAAGNQIPFYQAAAQLPAFQPPPQQQLLAKSPSAAQPASFVARSSFPSSPSVRSPNSNSSDFVKMKLQQKIRSRMVSKGQIPPNPTEEELRLCGIQLPNHAPSQSNLQSQLPTPKSSPQQIPRAFNNNAAAFIAAPVTYQDDFMKYLDVNCEYSQKDPLSMINPTGIDPLKQQQLQKQQQLSSSASDFLFQSQQQQLQQQQQQQQQQENTVNYDQFFSDFIHY